jgi:hypothetical protein
LLVDGRFGRCLEQGILNIIRQGRKLLL